MRFFKIYLPIVRFREIHDYDHQKVGNVPYNATKIVEFLKYVRKMVFWGKTRVIFFLKRFSSNQCGKFAVECI